MTGRLRAWLETRAEATPPDFTNLRIADAYQQVTGKLGVRGSAVYLAALNFIEDSLGIAQVEGYFSESLRPHLGSIGRGLSDFGECVFEIRLQGDGTIELVPSAIAAVTGGAERESWSYTLVRQGPTASETIHRPGSAVLAFTAHANPKTPWRGRGRLEASGTGDLLASLEAQLASESRFNPARAVSCGITAEQRKEVSVALSQGGLVAISAGGAIAATSPAGALTTGVIKNETSAAIVALHQSLSAQISSALGVPHDLLGGAASEAGTRESFRRFAASTISALIEIIKTEWALKVGEKLEINLDTLRAGDISAKARAVGSRANAFKNLVSGGVTVEKALQIAGLAE